MSELENLEDVLIDELKDLYSAETQLVKALPKVEKRAACPELKEAIKKHLGETQGHVERLEKIAEILDISLSGKTCKAMKGLIDEAKEAMDEESENASLIDLLLIGAAQRVEHYEMAAYGIAREMAKTLGHGEVVELLQATLEEEKAADDKLTDISESEVLPQASEGASEEEGEEEEDDEQKGLHL